MSVADVRRTVDLFTVVMFVNPLSVHASHSPNLPRSGLVGARKQNGVVARIFDDAMFFSCLVFYALFYTIAMEHAKTSMVSVTSTNDSLTYSSTA